MNTENGSDSRADSTLRKPFFRADGDSTPKKDDTLAALEEKVASLEDRLLEERFIWVLVCMFLIDAYIFTAMSNGAGAVVIGLLQLIAIVVLADKCQVNLVMPLIDKLTGAVTSITKNGKGDGA